MALYQNTPISITTSVNDQLPVPAKRRDSYGITWFHYGTASQILVPNILLTDMLANGIGRLRIQIAWSSIETSAGTYNWIALDDIVSRCNTAGIAITYPLQGQPSFYPFQTTLGTSNTSYVPGPAIASFALAVATRYNGLNGHGFIDRFELNEEFDSLGSGTVTTAYNDRHAKLCANIVKLVGPAIKSASPNAEFWAPTLWWNQFPHTAEFIAGMYEYQAMRWVDGITLHWYPYESGSNANQIDTMQWVYSYANGSNIGQEIVPNIWQAIKSMRDAMLVYGDLKKIRVTEVGWLINDHDHTGDGTNHNTMSQSLQWRNYYAFMECCRHLGNVEGFDFWTMDYGGLYSATSGSDGDSLVQWGGGTTWTYNTAWTGLCNYIKTFPKWDGQIGKANQTGFNQAMLAADLGIFLDSTLSPANPSPRNASASNFNGSSSQAGSDHLTWARFSAMGSGTQKFLNTSYMGITGSVTNRDMFAYSSLTSANVETQVCGQLNNSGDKLGLFICGSGSSSGTLACYFAELAYTSQYVATLSMYKVASGAFTSLGTAITINLGSTNVLGTDFRIRMRNLNGNVYAWAWQDTAQEPNDAQAFARIIDVISPITSGSFGVSCYSTTGTGVLFHSFMAYTTDTAGVAPGYVPIMSGNS